MAASRQAQFIQRRLARRAGGSDLLRLNKDYNRQISDLTREYETSFATYQKGASEKMAGFESSMASYNAALGEYESNVVAPYENAVEAYNRQAETYFKEVEELASGVKDFRVAGDVGRVVTLPRDVKRIDQYKNAYGWTKYDRAPLEDFYYNPDKYGFDIVGEERDKGFYIVRPLPTNKIPEKPVNPTPFQMEAPEMPSVTFDDSAFEQKRKELGETFKREVAERKSARLGAVQRRGRTMLSGA